MQSVTIEFDDVALMVEQERNLKDMSEEDVYWCFGADITFSDGNNDLYIEAPLFHFTKKLIGISSIADSAEREIADRYDSYRLKVMYKDTEILFVDEYGGGEVKLQLKELFKVYDKAFKSALEKLVENNNALNECNSFIDVSQKLSKELKSLS